MKPYNISHMIMSIGNHKKNYVMKINVVSIFIVLLALTSCVYNPQIEMFAHFKTKSSFHKTKRII